MINIGGDDVLTINVEQAEELQNNIRGLAAGEGEDNGRIIVTGYDNRELRDLLPADIEDPASNALDITVQINQDSQFTTTSGLHDRLNDADTIEVLAGATLTLSAAEADALSDKLIGTGTLVITNYTNEILMTSDQVFEDVVLLIDGPNEVEFRDIDIVDIANNTGIQSIQLADNAKMHADQYSGINLGELIKDEELRGEAHCTCDC